MPKVAVLGVCLLVGVLAGVTLRPGDGAAASLGSPAAVSVSALDHARALPPEPGTPVSVPELVVLAGAVLAALALAPSPLSRRRDEADGRPHRSARLSRAATRRGPPTVA